MFMVLLSFATPEPMSLISSYSGCSHLPEFDIVSTHPCHLPINVTAFKLEYRIRDDLFSVIYDYSR